MRLEGSNLEDEIESQVRAYKELKNCSSIIASISPEFFFGFCDNLVSGYEKANNERDGIYEDYQDLGKEKLRYETKVESLMHEIIELITDKEIKKGISSKVKLDRIQQLLETFLEEE